MQNLLSLKNFILFTYFYELLIFYFISQNFTEIKYFIITSFITLIINYFILYKIVKINFKNFKNLQKKDIMILLTSLKILLTILMISLKKNNFSNELIKNYLKYFQILSIYHQLEFLGIIFFRINQIEKDSFVLYHSKYYQIAFFISNLEILIKFFLNYFFFKKNINENIFFLLLKFLVFLF